MIQVSAYLRVSTEAHDVASQLSGSVRYCADEKLLTRWLLRRADLI